MTDADNLYENLYRRAVTACSPLQCGGDLSKRVGMELGDDTTVEGVTKLCKALREADAEIAELREAVRDIDGFIGTSPTNQLTEWHRWEKLPAVRRSLEEKP